MCVCVGKYFFIIVIIIIIIFFEIMMVLLFTVRPVTCHLVLLAGHWVSIVVVYNKLVQLEMLAVDKSKWLTLRMIMVNPIQKCCISQ